MAISLASIARTKHATPPRILIHGEEKCGKSTFFAGGIVNGQIHPAAPNPIYIPTEDGLNGIDTNAFPLCKSYDDVKTALTELLTQQHDFKTAILDSADWTERLIHEKVCKDEGKTSIVHCAGGYGNGYTVAMNYWREIVELLDQLNRQRKMIIGVICHSCVTEISDPINGSYTKASLKLHSPKKGNGAAELLQEWADVIGFTRKNFYVNQNGGRNLAVDSGERVNQLVLANNPACVSGNRYGLPDVLPLNWAAFSAAMSAASQPQAQPQQ